MVCFILTKECRMCCKLTTDFYCVLFDRKWTKRCWYWPTQFWHYSSSHYKTDNR